MVVMLYPHPLFPGFVFHEIVFTAKTINILRVFNRLLKEKKYCSWRHT